MDILDRQAGKSKAARPAAASSNRLPHSHISLKEWNTLLAVVRNDGFARAAEVLHISQPAISYTIAKIEERLGISILRQDGRRARITPLGQQLLAHVEPLVNLAVQVEAIARELRASFRPELGLAVVDDFPTALLIGAIRDFSEDEAGATVLLTEGSDEAVHQLLLKQKAELAITRSLAPDMQGELLAETEQVAVAHPDHPLFKLGRPLADTDLRQAIEIEVDPAPAGPAHAGAQRWRVSSLDTAAQALAQGIGYAWLPRDRVEAALADGRLAPLPLASYPPRSARFYLAHLASRPPGDEGKRLAAVLRTALESNAAAAAASPAHSGTGTP